MNTSCTILTEAETVLLVGKCSWSKKSCSFLGVSFFWTKQPQALEHCHVGVMFFEDGILSGSIMIL